MRLRRGKSRPRGSHSIGISETTAPISAMRGDQRRPPRADRGGRGRPRARRSCRSPGSRHGRAGRCRARGRRRRHSPPARGRAPAGRRRRGPAAEALREPTIATAGCCSASSRPRSARIGGAESIWRSSRRIFGLAQRDEAHAEACAPRQLALDLLGGRDADRPPRAAAPRQLRQRLQRRARAAAVVDERAKGARAHVLRADQPQPVERCSSVRRGAGVRFAIAQRLPDARFRARRQPRGYWRSA